MNIPAKLEQISSKCLELGFEMAYDEKVGSLLRTLIASKPAGRFLEPMTGSESTPSLDRLMIAK
jgi:hypothetical protein